MIEPNPILSTLRADCRGCVGLCCVAFAFVRSTDFPVDKHAGDPCTHLSSTYSCTIHDSLDGHGFRGCTAFDCFGAGQKVTRTLFPVSTWRDDPTTARSMFGVFRFVTALHELLWYLAQARMRTHDRDLVAAADELMSEITCLTETLDGVITADLDALRGRVRVVLVDVSDQVRASYNAMDDLDPGLVPNADLAGRDLRRRRLRGAHLTGSSLLRANLSGTDLSGCDLLGADMRGADIRGADLTNCLFLTATQLGGARGDHHTRLPEWSETPRHWP